MEKISICRQLSHDLLYGDIDGLIAALTEIRTKFGNVELCADFDGDSCIVEYTIEREPTQKEIELLATRNKLASTPFRQRETTEYLRAARELGVLIRTENEKYLARFD